jgi:hypothetical protein
MAEQNSSFSRPVRVGLLVLGAGIAPNLLAEMVGINHPAMKWWAGLCLVVAILSLIFVRDDRRIS